MNITIYKILIVFTKESDVDVDVERAKVHCRSIMHEGLKEKMERKGLLQSILPHRETSTLTQFKA
jgi:hypothetical protein